MLERFSSWTRGSIRVKWYSSVISEGKDAAERSLSLSLGSSEHHWRLELETFLILSFVFLMSLFQGWVLTRTVPTSSFWGIYSVIPVNCIQLFLVILCNFLLYSFSSCLLLWNHSSHVSHTKAGMSSPFCTQLMWISVICFLYLLSDNKAAALNPIYCSSLIHYFKTAWSIASFNPLSQLIESPKLLHYHFSVLY